MAKFSPSSKHSNLIILSIPMQGAFYFDAITGFSGESLSVGGVTLWMMATLLIGTVLMIRATKNLTGIYRFAAIVAIGTAFMVTWANGAVGIIGSEENKINLVYFVIIIMGFLGAYISDFATKGIALSLFSMGFIQMVIAIMIVVSINLNEPSMTLKATLIFLTLHGVIAGGYTFSGLLFLYTLKQKPTV